MKISDLVGNTPLIELRRICPNPRVRLLAKMESHNPGGSVKDRPALSMIEGAEARGELRPGVRLIEPTSGNTGIALAMIACAKGYELELVMPENSTAERVWTMRAFGAKVTLTPAEGSMEAAIDYAREKVARGEAVMLDQFSNPDNWRAHYRGTGPELWRDTKGTLTHFVSSMGTTGTIMGVSRFLKEQSPHVTIVGAQPADGAKIPGIRRWPKEYLPKIYEPSRVDRIVDVTQHDAEETTRRLAREEGVFCGVSAGGATWVALQIARELNEGVIAVIICDRGDRYLSSDLFRQEVS
ncbi:MAG: cysteine synthase CysM [Myxococcales bacterium]|nr:cysteine synthase CysM [Polyangiaceae bacterium]MDW8251327.1 cysteine synthase CysM [Myxococcales bacterium]